MALLRRLDIEPDEAYAHSLIPHVY